MSSASDFLLHSVKDNYESFFKLEELGLIQNVDGTIRKTFKWIECPIQGTRGFFVFFVPEILVIVTNLQKNFKPQDIFFTAPRLTMTAIEIKNTIFAEDTLNKGLVAEFIFNIVSKGFPSKSRFSIYQTRIVGSKEASYCPQEGDLIFQEEIS